MFRVKQFSRLVVRETCICDKDIVTKKTLDKSEIHWQDTDLELQLKIYWSQKFENWDLKFEIWDLRFDGKKSNFSFSAHTWGFY